MARHIKFATFLLAFAVVLGMDYFLWGPIQIGWLDKTRGWLLDNFRSTDMQRLQLICLTFYLAGFMVWLNRLRKPPAAMSVESFKKLCFIVLIAAALSAYFLRPDNPGGSSDLLDLLLGMVLGQGILLLKAKQSSLEQTIKLHKDLLHALVAVLALFAFFQPAWGQNYPYLNEYRWHGLWRTPNTFGLLMATGLVLVVGLCLHQLSSRVDVSKKVYYSYLAFYAIAACLITIGLKKSYSRSSWLGAALGIAYAACWFFKRMRFRAGNIRTFVGEKWIKRIAALYNASLRNRIPAGLIIVSAVVLLFWHFRDTEHLFVRRLFSIGNVNDFSWRNRIQAYEGSLQMIANQPWIGYGWGWPETIYDQFYKPATLDEAKVIELNDYFMLAMIMGLPVLTLFCVYLVLSFISRPFFKKWSCLKHFDSDKGEKDETWLKVCCRSGLIVLLTGFWFDHGLFYVSLTVPFWILLELGTTERFTVPRQTNGYP